MEIPPIALSAVVTIVVAAVSAWVTATRAAAETKERTRSILRRLDDLERLKDLVNDLEKQLLGLSKDTQALQAEEMLVTKIEELKREISSLRQDLKGA